MLCPNCESGEVEVLPHDNYKCKRCGEWFEATTNTEREPIKPTKQTKQEINWDIVEEQMYKNTQDRISWKKVLGMSLTRAVAKLKTEGLTADQTYDEICKAHPELSEEYRRRLKIGIAARRGELATALSEIAKKG